MYHPRRNPRPYRAETLPKHVLEDFKNISLFYNLFWAGGGFSAGGTPSPRRKPAHIGLKLHQNMSWTILRTFYSFTIYSERGSFLPDENAPPPRETPAHIRLTLHQNMFWTVLRTFQFFTIYSERRRIPRPDRAETSPKHVMDDFRNNSLFYNLFWAGGGFSARGTPSPEKPPSTLGWNFAKTCLGRF